MAVGSSSQGVRANQRGGGGTGVQISPWDGARNRADFLQKRMPTSRSVCVLPGGNAENTSGKVRLFLPLLGDLA